MTNKKKLFQGDMPTSAGSAEYTVPTGYKGIVRNVDVCNTTAASLTASIYLVPVGGSAATTNMLFPAAAVPAYSMVQWSGEQILNTGDFIQCVGSGSGLTANISGDEERL